MAILYMNINIVFIYFSFSLSGNHILKLNDPFKMFLLATEQTIVVH